MKDLIIARIPSELRNEIENIKIEQGVPYSFMIRKGLQLYIEDKNRLEH